LALTNGKGLQTLQANTEKIMMDKVIQALEIMFFADFGILLQNCMVMENAQQGIRIAMGEGF
jgi:hypothetical protein